MRVKPILTILTVMLSGIFYSCSDEETNAVLPTETNSIVEEKNEYEQFKTVSEEGEVINYLYYMDEKESEYFDLENEDLYIVVTTEPSEDGTEGVFRIWGFSSKEGYIKFGKKHGGDLGIGLEFEEHMRDYAVSSGAIKYYEETGKVPDWYMEYNKDYYESLFGTNESSKARTNSPFTTTSLYTDANPGQGRHTLMIGYTPFLFWGWNNEVSRYYNLHFYGVTTLHDRWAYRDPFFSLWNWGWNTVAFTGPLAFANDRMSSGFSFGFGF